MSIAAALAELQRSPALSDHIAQLQRFLVAEEDLRQQFRRDFEGKRGEFINGQIYISPPATPRQLDAIARVSRLLHDFVDLHDIGEVYGGKCLGHCQRNDYEPDICFFGVAKAAAFPPDPLLFPPPDLAVEVPSPSSAEHVRKLKWQDYARHGVGEYWIVDPDNRLVEQYVLLSTATEYQLKARLAEGGRLKSLVIVGLDIPIAAIFNESEDQRAPQST